MIRVRRVRIRAVLQQLAGDDNASAPRRHMQGLFSLGIRLVDVRVRDELGTPMLYVSHDVTEILRLTDRLLIIDDGECVAHGSLRDVATHASAWKTLRDLGSMNVLHATNGRYCLLTLTIRLSRAQRANSVISLVRA